MKVYRSLQDFVKGTSPVATIGTFDGVHLGHQVILNSLIRSAKERNGESVVISFHPHPRLVLFPEDNPLRLLQTIDEKIARLDELGIDKLLLIPFTREFSRMSSTDFIQNVLVDTVGISKLIVGYDHHFGRNRTGGLEELKSGAETNHFELEEIPAQQVDDANVSSTKIRQALGTGDVKQAARYLGYAYPLSGIVLQGDGIGKKLGFPTANIQPQDNLKLTPADGVYLTSVLVDEETKERPALCSIGTRPTIDGRKQVTEVFLMDYSGDLYGKTLRVSFVEYIRGQEKFPDLESLIAQMKKDEIKGRELLAQQNG